MFRPLAVYLGLRYTRARRRNHFISFISATSMLGIALGVTALITVLSVMNGFEQELRSRILGMTAHLTVLSTAGPLPDWREVVARLHGAPRVVGVAPYIEKEGMATHAGSVQGILVRGVDPQAEAGVSIVDQKLRMGRFDALEPGAFNVLLGQELAAALGVGLGSKITLIAPQPAVTPAGMLPRLKQFTVAGVFEIGMHEYDAAYALVHLEDAAKLFRFGAAVSGVRVELDDMFAARGLRADIAARAGAAGAMEVLDWSYFHKNFFRALRTEKSVMFVILTLIVAVAAFNIVSTLVMVVTDKQAEVAILRTLGLAPHEVMGVFMVQGTVIGLAGTALGVAGGVVLASNVAALVKWIEHQFQVHFLPADVYYISELPAQMRWADVAQIGCVAFVLTVLATLYPAWLAARTQPAQALRYE